ncbi:transcriptional regulator [Thermococcus sp. JdF3]|uniref:transcriptional regulator n=1 Tax=Thermococcus sp. JdF3 TaxID=1638258 RepID=UPI00143A0A77|nr:transcriptional regulator [Thermococcus sp. JdF3]NJE02060.1 ArsR family transcriptional regulator [Thermococcus sp. JdF3]
MEALRELSRNHVLGNPIRLGAMLYLLPRGRALFKELLEVLEVTPGNLDSHLKALEKAGYVELYKVFADRPRTAVRITEKGAKETGEYLRALKEALSLISREG